MTLHEDGAVAGHRFLSFAGLSGTGLTSVAVIEENHPFRVPVESVGLGFGHIHFRSYYDRAPTVNIGAGVAQLAGVGACRDSAPSVRDDGIFNARVTRSSTWQILCGVDVGCGGVTCRPLHSRPVRERRTGVWSYA